MNEKTHPHGLPKAIVEKSYLTWSLWLIPIAAACICGYFVLHDVVFSGPTVTIYFQNADGLQEKNSMVKYRGIKIGEVQSVKLMEKGARVAVTAKLDRSAGNLARQGSVFWIVRPELKVGSISGLRTIVSGNYVTVQPGSGARTNVFTGAEEAPIAPATAMNIVLLADDLDSLEKQSQIFYHGVQVGEVMDFRLSENARHVIVDARILQNYAALVRVNSKFWNAGGISVHAGLFSGIDISAQSAQTVVSGGIAFATPPDYGPAATNGTVFALNEKEDDAWKNWNPEISLQSTPQAQKEKNSLPEINPK